MNRYILFIALSLISPVLSAGEFGVLKPGARKAPVCDSSHGLTGRAAMPAAEAPAAARPDFFAVELSSAPCISSFRASYSLTTEKVMDLPPMSGYSGTAVGRSFMYMDYSVNSAGNITAVNWRQVDMDTKSIISTRAQQYALGVCMDMTYDPTTSTIYGISAVSDILVSIDPETGEASSVANTMPFYTLSADGAGQLYGIALDTDTGHGVLYSVNKATGTALKIGDTGVKMLTDESGTIATFQSAAFSSANGQLYWAMTNSEYTSALYRVDPSTGAAAYMAAFPDSESYVAMFDMPAPALPDAPAPVRDISATPDGMDVKISFTAPDKTADGSDLASISSIEIFRGNDTEAAYSLSAPEPGAAYSWTDTGAKAGFNAYRLVAANDAGESLPAYASAFCGDDYPAEPTAVSVSINAAGQPVIEWMPPQTGLNGLPLDSDKLSYIIQRDINGRSEIIAEGISGTSYTDTSLDLSRQLYPYYYVIAVSPAGEGRVSLPAGTYTGPAYKLPFSENFAEGNPTSAPWVMQSIDLGGTWEISLLSTFPGSGPYTGEGMLVFIGFRSVEGAEARIATPIMSFKNISHPELRFHFYYLDMSDQDLRFNDHMTVEISVDGGPFEPVEGADYYQHDANTRWTEVVLPLTDYAGSEKVSIGFHGYSGGGFDLLLDNIRVVDNNEAGIDETLQDSAPAQYFNLQGIPVDGHKLTPGIYIRRSGNSTDKVII